MDRETDAPPRARKIAGACAAGAKRDDERLAPRFAVIDELVRARKQAKLSQAELAKRMGVTAAVLSRMESAVHSPRIETLAEAARAMGHRLEMRFVPAAGTRAARTTGVERPERAERAAAPAREP